VLLVTMPVTPYLPGGAALAGTAAEGAAVTGHFGARVTALAGNQATRAAVLAALGHAGLAHFACHGATRPDDPSAGGLYLADGPLTIAELAGLTRPAAGLAFLSACESAAGSVRHLDEAITMTAAVALAGFGDVIGTLWYVADTVAPEVAAGVYARLGTGAPGPGQRAARGRARTARRRHPGTAVGAVRAHRFVS
jgi:CHAT domain-containing protein